MNPQPTLWSLHFLSLYIMHWQLQNDTFPTSFIDSNVSLNGIVRSWGTFPGTQHFGGRGACWSSGMGTRKSDKHQLLTRTCTNETTSWLMHSWSTFGAKMSHGQTQIHKTHHGLDLGETTTFPLIVCFVPLHETHIQMAFCPRTSKWESWNSQSYESCDFGAP
jgi:hypothetical protein